MRIKGPQRADDVVIHSEGPGAYVIMTMTGERIGKSENRRDAMLRACAALRDGEATVWICIDPLLDLYSEVLCP